MSDITINKFVRLSILRTIPGFISLTACEAVPAFDFYGNKKNNNSMKPV